MTEERELWRAWRASRSPELREQLIDRYLVLVRYVAARVAGRLPRHLALEDLYSAGLLGFLGALDDYDPDVGVAFASYATPRIRGAIFDELRRLDLVPRSVRRRMREVERAIEEVSARLDRLPTDDEIAAELNTTTEAYHRLLGEAVTVVSLDAGVRRGDDEGEGIDVEDTRTPGPLAALAASERREILAGLIERLPKREQQVLALYYVEELTMREIGEVLGVTESRVSQLHSGAILKLRAGLRRHRLREPDLLPLPQESTQRHRA